MITKCTTYWKSWIGQVSPIWFELHFSNIHSTLSTLYNLCWSLWNYRLQHTIPVVSSSCFCFSQLQRFKPAAIGVPQLTRCSHALLALNNSQDPKTSPKYLFSECEWPTRAILWLPFLPASQHPCRGISQISRKNSLLPQKQHTLKMKWTWQRNGHLLDTKS